MEINKETRTAFIEAIIEIYAAFGLSLGHEDSQGSFLIEEYKEDNVKWIKQSIDYYV